MGVMRRMEAQKRASSRRRLSETEKRNDIRKSYAEAIGKEEADVTNEKVEEIKESSSVLGVLETAEGCNKEAKLGVDEATRKEAYKTCRDITVKDEIARLKHKATNTITKMEIKRYLAKATREKMKKRVEALVRVENSGGRRRLTAQDERTSLKDAAK